MTQTHHYTGLTEQEVAVSREKYGENVLTPPKRTPLWIQYLAKFTDPIIIILLVALLLSTGVAFYEYSVGESDVSAFLEPAGILLAVLLATTVGFFFEVSANKKFEVLNQVNDDTAVKVIRNGSIHEVAKREVVVDDIVVLSTGEEVPADGELIEAVSLQINESTLTGEPVVKKSTESEEFDAQATYPTNHVLKGTSVVDGHGIMRVLSVGDATEYGKVYEGAQIDNSVKTPLNKQLDRLSALITKVSYILAALIFVGRLLTYFHAAGGFVVSDWILFGAYLLQTAMIAVTVIVVAVPEGLAMSVTFSLALSMKRMLSTNNLVRKMHACETMGATTVICTDKTGTLTQNQMRVYETKFFNEGQINAHIQEGIAVNTTAFLDFSNPNRIEALGNPTEGALLLWLHDKGADYEALRDAAPLIEQLTFSTERKYMATIVQSAVVGKRVLYAKGAPEYLLDFCPHLPLAKEELFSDLLVYQNKAMRTLGLAYQVLEDGDTSEYIKDGRLNGVQLTLMGIIAISDPIRADVPAAVKECLAAGIDVKIVTGDTPGTAKEIGRQVGLWRDNEPEANQMTGTQFAAMSDAELLERILDLKIMSRARPSDKQRLVQLLQQKSQVVAVTGDGTNDAPALNAAQVGLSMGDGTSVAKEASDITILDNSFTSITRAVMWGRSLYQNIQRFILFQMTINVAACLIVLLGAFLGTESPLTVTQMLWVNLIMDTFAAMALASLPPNERVMRDKPRDPAAHIITRAMAHNILGVGLLFVILLLGLVQYFKHTDLTSLTQFDFAIFVSNFCNFSEGTLSPYELSLFFTTFVSLQFWNMFNAKAFLSGRSAFFALRESKGFLAVGGIILLGQFVIVTFAGSLFGIVPLKAVDWAIIFCATSLVLWVGELVRLFRK